MIMYRTNYNNISKHEILKETRKTVKYRVTPTYVRTEHKASEFIRWFHTFKEAKQYIVNQLEDRLKYIRLNLERVKGDLGRVRGMREGQCK